MPCKYKHIMRELHKRIMLYVFKLITLYVYRYFYATWRGVPLLTQVRLARCAVDPEANFRSGQVTVCSLLAESTQKHLLLWSVCASGIVSAQVTLQRARITPSRRRGGPLMGAARSHRLSVDGVIAMGAWPCARPSTARRLHKKCRRQRERSSSAVFRKS